MKYVQQVRGKWVVRMVVPEELRTLVGQRELVEIGLPAETRAREKRATAVINSLHAKLDEAREVWAALGEACKPTLSSAAKEHYSAELVKNDLEHATIRSQEVKETAGFFRSNYANRLRLLVSGQIGTEEAEALIGYAADDLKAKGRAPGVPRPELLRTLAEIQLEALERFEEREAGAIKIAPPAHPLLTQADPVTRTMSAAAKCGDVRGLTLTQALEGLHRARSRGQDSLAPRTMEEHRNAARMFNEFMGADLPVGSITKKNIIDYKQALQETPTRYTLRFPGLTLPQAIKANAKLSEPFQTLAPQTINMKWLSHLSSIFSWAVENAHLSDNPAHGVQVATGKKANRKPSYLPFSKSELKKIFGDPIFAEPTTYGLNQWALLVMLYTGVRNSSEMARMKLENIYEEQGVPVFFLAEASKNEQSRRLVPIHRDLVELGFLDYVQRQRAAGETLLFPAWAKRPDKVNDWFNGIFLVNIGLKNKQKVFYCFRHTLATELARVGVPREISKMISGHAPQEVASVYIQASPVTLMAEALNRVKFDLGIPGLR